MKKIILAITNDISYDQRLQRICTTLAAAGYAVTLVGRELSTSIPLSERPFEQKRLRCWVNKGKFFYLEYNIRLLLYLLTQRAHILVANDLDTILPMVAVGKIKGYKLVFDAHEYFSEVPEVMHRPATKWIWERVAHLCIPFTAARYTVCRSLADLFAELYGTDFVVVRNLPFASVAPVYSDAVAPILSRSAPKIILYQGALNAGRGLEELIAAMPHIDAAVLWLVGEGDCSVQLRTLVNAKSVSDKVVFLGRKTPEELREITKQAYLGVNLLQHQSLNYYYSLANKYFDYIQAEVPSVNMDYPEYQRHLREYEVGIMLPQTLEPAAIATAINGLLVDGARYECLQANCRLAKAVYTWENERKVLLAVYAEL